MAVSAAAAEPLPVPEESVHLAVSPWEDFEGDPTAADVLDDDQGEGWNPPGALPAHPDVYATLVSALHDGVRRAGGYVPPSFVSAFEALLFEFRDVFAWEVPEAPSRLPPIRVEFIPGSAVVNRSFRQHGDEAEFVQRRVAMGVAKGVYRVAHNNEWASPGFAVPKPKPGAGLMAKYRFVVSLIELNAASAPFLVNPLDMRVMLGAFSGAACFSQWDGVDAFTQQAVEASSQRYFGIGLPTGTVVSTRSLQGWVNSPAWLQYGLRSCFDEAQLGDVMVYVDDMAYGRPSFDEHLQLTRRFFVTQRAVNFKLKPTSKPFTVDMVFCGLRLRPGSWSKLPLDMERLRRHPLFTGADLAWVVGVLLWFCGTVALLNRDLEPLRVVQRAVQGVSLSAKSRSLARVPLAERVGWDDSLVALVQSLWDRVEHAVPLSLPTVVGAVVLFGDASDKWWAFLVAQVKRYGSRPLTSLPPLDELEILYVGSGMFEARAQRWDVREREAAALVKAVEHGRHFFLGRPVVAFTDHQPLIALFKHPEHLRLVQSGARVQRWVSFLNRYHVDVVWVPGTSLFLVDALTRTDSRTAAAVSGPGMVRALADVAGSDKRPARREARVAAVARFQRAVPEVASGVGRPAPSHLVHTNAPEWEFPTLEAIRARSADADVVEEALHAGCELGRDGLLRHGDAVFLPAAFRPVMVSVAHGSVAGHRAWRTTVRALRGFWWPSMEEQVRAEVESCYSCLAHRAPRVPRPFGDVLFGTELGQVLCADFFQFPAAPFRGREVEYLLVLKDSLSGFVTTYLCAEASSSEVLDALVDWVLRYHTVPRTLLTDGGSHFRGVLTAAVQHLFVERRWSVEYAPWSNGAVERVGRDLIDSVRRLLTDTRRFTVGDWPECARLATFVVNNTPSVRLGNQSPASVFLGRAPLDAADLVGRVQPALGSRRPLSTAQVRAFAERLAERLESARRTAVESSTRARERSHRLQAARRGVRPLSVEVGDWVMVSREAFPAQTNAPVTKVSTDWFGPAQVEGVPSEHFIEVRVFGERESRRVSASHVQFFHDSDLALTPEMRELAQASVPSRFLVRDIVGIKFHVDKGGRRHVRLLVKWEHYDDEPPTEQDLHELYGVMPATVLAFLARAHGPEEASVVVEARRRLGVAQAAGDPALGD